MGVGASLGSAHLYDVSAGTYYALLTSSSGDNVRLAGHGVGLSGTSPVTLAAGDVISVRLRYPIA